MTLLIRQGRNKDFQAFSDLKEIIKTYQCKRAELAYKISILDFFYFVLTVQSGVVVEVKTKAYL